MNELLEPWLKVDLGEGAFQALLGLAFVFAGILILVCIFTLFGFIMKKINERRANAVKSEPSRIPVAQPVGEENGDEIPDEVVAAIMAALMSYYQKENVRCDFVVRRIKRIEGVR